MGHPQTTWRVHVILPAYNEGASLARLLQRLSDPGLRITNELTVWVVDDGSTDTTRAVAMRGAPGLDVRVVAHKVNRGLGRALSTGLTTVLASADPDDVVVVMDADDTHDVQLIPALAAKLREGAAIAIASRFTPGGDDSTAPAFRRLLSRSAATLFSALIKQPGVTDFTSGYRAYRVSIMHQAATHWGERLIEEQGFACMVELMMKLSRYHPPCAEVPLVLRYDRKQGASKLPVTRTVLQYCKLAARHGLSPRLEKDEVHPALATSRSASSHADSLPA